MPSTTDLETGSVLDLLSSLAEKSLVVHEEVEGVVRFRLLEMVKAYGRDLQEEHGEDQWIRGAHRDYYVRLAESMEPRLSGPEQADALDAFEVDHDNFRQALQHCLQEENAAVGLRLVAAMGMFWKVRGYWREGMGWCDAFLRLPASDDSPSPRAKVLNTFGTLAEILGDLRLAGRLLEQALEIREQQGDRAGAADTLNNLGVVSARLADYERSKHLHERSLEISRSLNDARGIAIALSNLGIVALDTGDFELARKLLLESLAMKRKIGDRRGTANTLSNLAVMANEQGDPKTAWRLQKEAYEIRCDLGDKQGIATSLNNLGQIACDRGDFEEAKRHFEESIAIRRELRSIQGLGLVLGNLGKTLERQGNIRGALELYKETIGYKHQLGDRKGVAMSLEMIAKLCVDAGQARAATLLFGFAVGVRKSLHTPVPPSEHLAYQQAIERLRQKLPTEEFELGWVQGRNMGIDRAIEIANSIDL